MKKAPIFTLVALAVVMPELVTGSTTFFSFFNPVILLILFVGYGVTVLLIREFFVRLNFNFFGLFMLGFAYLIVNEGLLAKTLTLENGIPFSVYDNYGYVLGISVPWALSMGLWHSMYSVVFPIVATHFLFPSASREPWLGKKVSSALSLLVAFVSFGAFFGPHRGAGSLDQLVIFFGWVLVCVAVAWFFGRAKEDEISAGHTISTKPVWLGVSTIIFITVLLSFIVAGMKLPLIVFFGIYVSGIAFYIRTIQKKVGIHNDTLLLFILGGYFQTAVTGILLAVFFLPALLGERLIAEIIILVFSVFLTRRVLQKGRVQQPAVTS